VAKVLNENSTKAKTKSGGGKVRVKSRAKE